MQACLLPLHHTLLAKQYTESAMRNYVQEMRFLFAHYYHLLPQSISQPGIIHYICYIIKAHGVGRKKCLAHAGKIRHRYYAVPSMQTRQAGAGEGGLSKNIFVAVGAIPQHGCARRYQQQAIAIKPHSHKKMNV